MAKDKTDGRRRSTVNKILRETVQGRSISVEFFRRYAIYIVGLNIMVLCYIGNKNIYQSRQEMVLKLQSDLKDAKTDLVDMSARYNSMVRESHMVAYVDSFNLPLTAPDRPPYVISE